MSENGAYGDTPQMATWHVYIVLQTWWLMSNLCIGMRYFQANPHTLSCLTLMTQGKSINNRFFFNVSILLYYYSCSSIIIFYNMIYNNCNFLHFYRYLSYTYSIWLFNIAMERSTIFNRYTIYFYRPLSMAMLVITRGYI